MIRDVVIAGVDIAVISGVVVGCCCRLLYLLLQMALSVVADSFIVFCWCICSFRFDCLKSSRLKIRI